MGEDLFVDQDYRTETSVCDMYKEFGKTFETEVESRKRQHDEVWDRFLIKMNEEVN